jgi:hypothetical protein
MTDQSPTVGSLAKALAAAQAKMEPAKKDKLNPFFKSNYADLASIWDAARDALAANGLAVIQATDTTESGAVVLVTTLAHESGEWVKGRYPIHPVKNDPQSLGSAVSYARRYSLSALIGVVTEDDDGEAAVGRGRQAEKPADAPRRNGAPPMPVAESVAVLLDLVNKSKDVADLAKNWGVVMQSRGQLNAADLAKLTKAKDAMKSRLAVPAGDSFEG